MANPITIRRRLVIAGFTPISEGLTPEELAAHMSEYFEGLIETIHRHGGEVNQLLGDGALSFWGAPRHNPDHATQAVEAALEFKALLAELNSDWHARGKPALPTRFGMNTGEVMVGNVGSKSRIAYSAVGDAVNVASRIEGINKFYGTTILASGRVRDGDTDDRFEWRHVDSVRAKGKPSRSSCLNHLVSRATYRQTYAPLGMLTNKGWIFTGRHSSLNV